MGDVAIGGIGNPYRGDDGAGWAVIDGLKNLPVKLVKMGGDIAELLDLFAHHQSVYLVDACLGGLPGQWKRIDLLKEPLMQETPQTSTHGFTITQALSLAGNLGQLPPKLILYAISIDNYTMSEGLSKSVEEAVKGVIEALLKEEELCTNRA